MPEQDIPSVPEPPSVERIDTTGAPPATLAEAIPIESPLASGSQSPAQQPQEEELAASEPPSPAQPPPEAAEPPAPTISEEKQTSLRREIIAIQQDASLTPAERARKMQQLMSSGWTANRVHADPEDSGEQRLEDAAVPTAEELQVSYNDEDSDVLGCQHYKRNVKLKAACCGRFFPCRFCHDDVCDHKIVRKDTRLMLCMRCKLVQPAGPKCMGEGCGILTARYYCDVCRLWDNDEGKSVYHCDKCGICRIGQGLGIDFFHCDTCNICLGMNLQGNHRCIERNLESNCPICNEFMFTSTTTVIFMRCGHSIHYDCHQEHIKSSFQCPTCLKSLGDMSAYYKQIERVIQAEKMPAEYDAFATEVFCNDCVKRSYARCHFQFHRCGHCKGYNTSSLGNHERKSLEGVDWEEIDGPATFIRERMSGAWPSDEEEAQGGEGEDDDDEDDGVSDEDEENDGWILEAIGSNDEETDDTDGEVDETSSEEEGETETEDTTLLAPGPHHPSLSEDTPPQ